MLLLFGVYDDLSVIGVTCTFLLVPLATGDVFALVDRLVKKMFRSESWMSDLAERTIERGIRHLREEEKKE